MIEVPLSEIRELDECFWFGEEDDPTSPEVALHARVRRKDLRHPIILCSDGKVMDGMHRGCKALNEGSKMIWAVQFAKNPDPDHVDVQLKDLPYDEAW